MKKFLLCALFLAGCSTNGPKPLYEVDSCIQLTEEIIAKLPPPQQEFMKAVKMSIVDVGTVMYVVETALNAQVVNRQAAPFVEVEQVTKEVECSK